MLSPLFAMDPWTLQFPLAGLVILAALGIGINTWLAIISSQPLDEATVKPPLAPPAESSSTLILR